MHNGHDISYTSSSSSDSMPAGAECPDCVTESELNRYQHRQERHVHHREAPAYPKRHSFVVDMNNRPHYETERNKRQVAQVRSTISLGSPATSPSKHSVKTQAPERNAHTPTKMILASGGQEAPPAHETYTQTADGKLSHLPSSPDSAPFYPRNKKQDEPGWCRFFWIKFLVAVLVVVAFIILFAILGEVVETHGLMRENYKLLDELKKDLTTAKDVSRG